MNKIPLIATVGLLFTLVLALPLDKINDVDQPEDGSYFTDEGNKLIESKIKCLIFSLLEQLANMETTLRVI